MKYKHITLVFFLMFIANKFIAQNLHFQSYSSAQGLSQNSGFCITQDGLGHMWMGTQDGLNKFNGKQIVTYYKENITRGTLANNFIKSLYYDSTQNWLWIGTGSGLCIYNIKADSFYNAAHYFAGTPALNELMIRSVTGISPYETIVVTFYEGAFICNSKLKTVQQYFQQPGIKDKVTTAILWNNKIIAAAAGQLYEIKEKPTPLLASFNFGDARNLLVWQNDLWISSTTNGLFKISATPAMNAVAVDCGSKEIGPLITDNDNNLWIGTRNKGIIIMQSDYKMAWSFETATNQDEWPQKFTLSFFKDRQGIVWTGSSGGGFSACDRTSKPFGLIRKREELPGKAAHNMILSMYPGKNNNIFLGTQLEGIRDYDVKTGQTTSYINTSTPGASSIYGITASSAADLWLATPAGLQHFNTVTKKFISYINPAHSPSLLGQSVYKLKNADSLLYSSANGTVFFDLRNKQFEPFSDPEKPPGINKLVVYKCIEDEKGVLWLGCLEKGLLKYDLHTKQVTVIDTILHFSNAVYSIYNDNGILWLGTSNGLLIYDSKRNKIRRRFSLANGLPGNVIYSIEKDNEGNIWCSSNVGLIKVSPVNFSILHITVSAGLQSGEFNTACSLKDPSGNLYFGGINGVSFFNPLQFAISQYSPAPVIESFNVFNKAIPLAGNIAYTKEIKLSHDQNFITLDFAVTNYSNNEACIYRYRLSGTDKDWVVAGNRTYANYTNLQPGKYLFRLQSANSSDIWSDETTLQIIITPAWWQTWWLRVAAIFLLAAIIIGLIRKRFNTIKQNSAIKQKITETEMAALKAQMNPHFMFNCINSIDAFIHSNDKYNATLYLNKFAKLLRNILDSSKQNTVLLSKDIETLKLYIELEELRHENKFTTSLTVDEEMLSSDYKVPPLIIQPFVENAILHGIKNKYSDDGLLSVDIKKLGEKIQYTISDNGIGRTAAAKIMQNKESHYGMQMSYDRIKLFNKEDTASVIVTDLYHNEKPAGTQVIVKLNTN